MKKLFTLLALLTCFLGVKAVTVVDVEVDYSTAETWSHGWLSNDSYIAFEDGCIHFHSTEATSNFYDLQFQAFPGVSDLDSDALYTITLKIKGTVEQELHASFSGSGTPGSIPVTTDWQTVVLEGCKDDPTAQYFASSGSLLIQCGDYVGDWWVSYIKITHEEKDQKPVQWANILVNGDAEGEYGDVPCAYSKEWGTNVGENGSPNPHVAEIENGVFVSHAKTVDPILVWDSDGEQWGQQHSQGDPMPDNTWQNQFWINFPRPMKDSEPVKLSFKYKASKDNIRVTTQDHKAPGDYLGGGKVGELTFTTEWKEYSKEFSAAAGVQSIAFNFGEDQHYLEDIDFYFDDLNVSLMVLDEGYFAAAANTETGLVEYDFDKAVELTYDEGEDAYIATVGTAGDQDSWVNQVMVSTVRGNDKAFKAATLKPSGKIANDEWTGYGEGNNVKIDLPAAGVWTIAVAPGDGLIRFTQVEGDAIAQPIEINPNPTEVIIYGQERDFTADEQPVDEEAGIAAGTGQTWDNQFFIIANRPLKPNEETILEFDYFADAEVTAPTGTHAMPGQYRKNAFDEEVHFTTEEQHFSVKYVIPEKDWGGNAITDAQSISFDLAVLKDACNYTIKNIVWKLADDTESLIDEEGTKNFFVKEGANTAPYEFNTIGSISIVGDFLGSWAPLNAFNNGWDMNQDRENSAIWTLSKEVEVEAGTYQYKATANHRWGYYELPGPGNPSMNAEGNQDFVFGTEGYPAGKYILNFTANTNEHTLTLDVQPAGAQIIKGDANGDGIVDVEDVVAIVNKILNEPDENFNEAAADVTGDGVIDVDDVVQTVNIILGEYEN